MSEAALEGYRALDLTDEKGFLCGRILGDLGVDVIKVEPPGGEPSRRIGPFYRDIPDPEKSLYWFFYNANKRGITLDIRSADGQDIFKRLVKSAHFVIESFPPGYMSQLGLGFSSLSQINPAIIMASITPFGQDGPYAGYKGSDLVCAALGGMAYVTGDPDRPPVRVSVPQVFLNAAAEAAAGTMIAHYYRQRTGVGQQVDVSAQQSVVLTTANGVPIWELNQIVLRRSGGYRTGLSASEAKQRQVYRCKDGYIIFVIMAGAGMVKSNQALMQWMESEGMADDFLRGIDWTTFDMAKATSEVHKRMEEPLSKFFMRHTKAELYEGALKRRVWLYPVSTASDLLQNAQLRARGFWNEVEHPELGAKFVYPGAFAKLSETSCGIRRRAPLIGEHNYEIFGGELGLSTDQISALKQAGVI